MKSISNSRLSSINEKLKYAKYVIKVVQTTIFILSVIIFLFLIFLISIKTENEVTTDITLDVILKLSLLSSFFLACGIYTYRYPIIVIGLALFTCIIFNILMVDAFLLLSIINITIICLLTLGWISAWKAVHYKRILIANGK